MDDWISPFMRRLAISVAFTSIVSSAAGVSLMLRSNQVLTKRVVFSAILSSMAACIIVYLMLFELMESRPMLLCGVSILSGAGGASTLDLMLMLLRHWAKKKAGDEIKTELKDVAGRDIPKDGGV